jgi:excisionase family DNA binding protein
MSRLDDTRWLTTAQAADRLQLSEETVRDWARSGFLPHARLSRKTLRFRASDLDDLMTEHLEPQTILRRT